ncbi:MAG: sigma-70 family RNA polymerase sigma factor [Lewinellaceae bacterium]|nr:sigma-70 family RNA polymerase sigma factor [Saprospiraceae bacterium]MCB0542722.1 sigma-70 family RNA polymerase sigma factor [Saprospiraceae bacterium]MCB9356747.1 sigma-70 family RNA polymerase sigma factor [Lewinellaceae bacterium]
MTETEILRTVEACLRRDIRAEKVLFEYFAPRVFALARRYAPDETAAQDFLQECFVAVFDRLKKFDPARGEFGAWLYRVSVNTCLQLLRREKQQPPLDFGDVPVLVDDLGSEDLLQIPEQLVLEGIRQLPAGYRQVFNLAVFEEWPHRDISAKLGISESASRSQLVRAKQFLKNFIKKSLPSYEPQRLV